MRQTNGYTYKLAPRRKGLGATQSYNEVHRIESPSATPEKRTMSPSPRRHKGTPAEEAGPHRPTPAAPTTRTGQQVGPTTPLRGQGHTRQKRRAEPSRRPAPPGPRWGKGALKDQGQGLERWRRKR